MPALGTEGLKGASMASTLPLENMTLEEKLQAMESLWADLCSRAVGPSSPAWHMDTLAERKGLLARGEDQFEDWDKAKRKIRNTVS